MDKKKFVHTLLDTPGSVADLHSKILEERPSSFQFFIFMQFSAKFDQIDVPSLGKSWIRLWAYNSAILT